MKLAIFFLVFLALSFAEEEEPFFAAFAGGTGAPVIEVSEA